MHVKKYVKIVKIKTCENKLRLNENAATQSLALVASKSQVQLDIP